MASQQTPASIYEKLSARATKEMGLPDGFKTFSPFPFGSMNQQSSRVAIGDQEFFFKENFIRIGDGNLRTLWDRGAAIYTAPSGKTIVYFFFYNIGAVNYAAVFLSDGTAVQVNTTTFATTNISSTSNTFYIGTQLPATSQWGTLYLIITNNITSDSYWIWDGKLLYGAGSLGPGVTITDGGSGYSSSPTVIIFGGSGSGATAVATISNGSVVNVIITNVGTGYLPGDVVQLAFSGGGSDRSAILQAVLSVGTIGHVQLLAPGSGYTNGTYALGFAGGGGTGAAGTYTVTGTVVTSINVTNFGSGYTGAPIVSFPSGGGTGAIGLAILNPGSVASVTVVNGGSNFTGTPTLTFQGGGGTGAAATAVIAGAGQVISLAFTAGTALYQTSSPPGVSFSGGGGSGAAASVITTGTSPNIVVTGVILTNAGSGYTSAPTVTITGTPVSGSAPTVVATVNLSTGAIVSVTVTNGGSGYTSAPSIVVQTGVNNAAAATATLMPFGVSGSSIETFQQRVWLPFPNQVGNQENGGTFLVSSPGSLTDFAPSDGGLTYTSTDSFLRYQYTNIKQSNGYLYPIGDSSVEVISNVQTSGTPATTTFNYQNTDPQVGTSWRDTVIDYSRTILLANPLGVYGLYGGSVTKISGKMDDLFNNMVQPQNGGVTPCSAIANIFSQKIFIMLMTITDPFTATTRNAMIGWDEKEWFVASQSINLTYIGTQEVNSDLTAWGTDGSSLFPLFNAPSANLNKTISTKLYGAQTGFIEKQAMSLYVQAQDLTETGTGIVFNTTTIDTELGQFPIPNTVQFPAVNPVTPLPAPVFPTAASDVVGVNLGITMTSSSPDFALQNLMLGYVDVRGIFGSTNLNNGEEEGE